MRVYQQITAVNLKKKKEIGQLCECDREEGHGLEPKAYTVVIVNGLGPPLSTFQKKKSCSNADLR
jgi:hypothetical protein